MNKLTLTLAGAGTLMLAGTANAQCPYAMSDATYTAHPAVMHGAMQATGFVRTGGMAYGTKTAAQPDIVDTAVSAGSFNTLVKAVQAAGLVDTLKGKGPFTVFAPTDAAFAKLPEGTLEALLADKEKLARVLKYHVVAGELDASEVTSMKTLATVEGSELPVSSISIAKTDIMTANGVIHVIDEVLIPAS
jgi:uncharacterized surface protein with fasciclin (FAS1) repeats